MSEIKEKGLFINPYVIQMDRFADSLRHLSETFLSLEEYHQTFTREELEDMFIKSFGEGVFKLRGKRNGA